MKHLQNQAVPIKEWIKVSLLLLIPLYNIYLLIKWAGWSSERYPFVQSYMISQLILAAVFFTFTIPIIITLVSGASFVSGAAAGGASQGAIMNILDRIENFDDKVEVKIDKSEEGDSEKIIISINKTKE